MRFRMGSFFPATVAYADPDQFLFRDRIHPTTAAPGITAQAAVSILAR